MKKQKAKEIRRQASWVPQMAYVFTYMYDYTVTCSARTCRKLKSAAGQNNKTATKKKKWVWEKIGHGNLGRLVAWWACPHVRHNKTGEDPHTLISSRPVYLSIPLGVPRRGHKTTHLHYDRSTHFPKEREPETSTSTSTSTSTLELPRSDLSRCASPTFHLSQGWDCLCMVTPATGAPVQTKKKKSTE